METTWDWALPGLLVAVMVETVALDRCRHTLVGMSSFVAAVRFGFHPAFATRLAVVATVYVACVGLGLACR